jgi:hypothetical protein
MGKSPFPHEAGEIDEEIILFLINIKRGRLRHWKEEVKTKKPEQLAPPISF